MKSILKSVLVLAVMVASIAHGDEGVSAMKVNSKASIWMDSRPYPGTTILYSCSALEDKTKNLLKKLGATEIKVTCSSYGRSPFEPSYSPVVTATFSAALLPHINIKSLPVMATWQNVKLHDFGDCNTTNQILVGLLRHVETRGLTLRACASNASSYKYDFQVLVAK